MIDRRTLGIAAVLVAVLAAGLTAYEVYGGARHGRWLVGAWAIGVAVISWWAIARPAPQSGARSFVAGAGAAFGLAGVGVIAGMLVASSGYGRWRDSALASADRFDTPEDRARARAFAEHEATFGGYFGHHVAPKATWPLGAMLPIAVLIGVVGYRERRESLDEA